MYPLFEYYPYPRSLIRSTPGVQGKVRGLVILKVRGSTFLSSNLGHGPELTVGGRGSIQTEGTWAAPQGRG
eukprot:2656-Hanusia_phi.AAC.1